MSARKWARYRRDSTWHDGCCTYVDAAPRHPGDTHLGNLPYEAAVQDDGANRAREPQRGASMTQQVFIAGHVTQDVSATGVRLGGPALYGAATYLALGASVTLSTSHAESRSPLARVTNLRLREDNDRSIETTTLQHTGDGGARVSRRLGARANPLRAPKVLRPFQLVHLAPAIGEISLHATGSWQKWLAVQRAHYRPPLVVLGLQGWLPTVEGSGMDGDGDRDGELLRRFDLDDVLDALPRVDVIFCSDGDLSLTRPGTLARLRRRSSLVVRTHGADGCTVYERSAEQRFPAQRTTAVDPTGAGDTFAAAFSYALARGERLPRCARLAARFAARCVQAVGVPTFDHTARATRVASLTKVAV